jgi:hypothetical protein
MHRPTEIQDQALHTVMQNSAHRPIETTAEQPTSTIANNLNADSTVAVCNNSEHNESPKSLPELIWGDDDVIVDNVLARLKINRAKPDAVSNEVSSPKLKHKAAEELLFSTKQQSALKNHLTRLNVIAKQVVTIAKEDTDQIVNIHIALNDSAATAAHNINACAEFTGVNVDCLTTAVLKGFTIQSIVSMSIKGNNLNPIKITAQVSKHDLTKLKNAFNNVASDTGITATLNGSRDQITLSNYQGSNIEIYDFSPKDAFCKMDVVANGAAAEYTILNKEHNWVVVSGCVKFAYDETITITSTVKDEGTLVNSVVRLKNNK